MERLNELMAQFESMYADKEMCRKKFLQLETAVSFPQYDFDRSNNFTK